MMSTSVTVTNASLISFLLPLLMHSSPQPWVPLQDLSESGQPSLPLNLNDSIRPIKRSHQVFSFLGLMGTLIGCIVFTLGEISSSSSNNITPVFASFFDIVLFVPCVFTLISSTRPKTCYGWTVTALVLTCIALILSTVLMCSLASSYYQYCSRGFFLKSCQGSRLYTLCGIVILVVFQIWNLVMASLETRRVPKSPIPQRVVYVTAPPMQPFGVQYPGMPQFVPQQTPSQYPSGPISPFVQQVNLQ